MVDLTKDRRENVPIHGKVVEVSLKWTFRELNGGGLPWARKIMYFLTWGTLRVTILSKWGTTNIWTWREEAFVRDIVVNILWYMIHILIPSAISNQINMYLSSISCWVTYHITWSSYRTIYNTYCMICNIICCYHMLVDPNPFDCILLFSQFD